MARRYGLIAATLLACASILACGDSDEAAAPVVDLSLPVYVAASGPAPHYLSEYNLFTWDQDEGFVFHEDVVPYEMNTPLFTDYALKSRAIYLPEGTSFEYEENDVFDFPVGTLILKTFYYAADIREPEEDIRLIETRILVRRESGWTANPYIWNEAQTHAVLSPSGQVRQETFIGFDGAERTANYLVPQRTQCQSCHDQMGEDGSSVAFLPIGPKSRYLNRDYDYGSGAVNQLEHMAARGWITGLPAVEDVPRSFDFAPYEREGLASIDAEDVDAAARDYLDINCAHCHSPTGVQGVSSQLFLNHDSTDEFQLGVCKKPGSAGRGTGGFDYDIVPGAPDESILHFRIDTVSPGAMMPMLARSLRHDEGVELIHYWIEQMESDADCSENTGE